MALARFMARPIGRILRIIAGVVLIAVGLLVVGDTAGIIVAAIGLLPILAGVFNVCAIAPLIGAPFAGKDALR
jgi:sulfite exporter TauE/SafE